MIIEVDFFCITFSNSNQSYNNNKKYKKESKNLVAFLNYERKIRRRMVTTWYWYWTGSSNSTSYSEDRQKISRE